MNIIQLKYFISVVEHGGITAAAKDQFISMQGMSQAISDLEAEIGTPLLIRQSRGSIPTEFGSEFYERALLLLHCHEDLELFVKDRVGNPPNPGELNLYVCAPSYSSTERAGLRIAGFINESFGVRCAVRFGSKGTCLLALQERRVDAVITIGHAAEDAVHACAVLGHVPCAVQISKNNPLSKKKFLRLRDAGDTPLMLWPRFGYFNENVLALLARKHAPFKPISLERPVKGVISFLCDGGGMLIPHIGQLDSDYLNTKPVLFHPDEGMYVPLCVLAPKTGCAKEITELINWSQDTFAHHRNR